MQHVAKSDLPTPSATFPTDPSGLPEATRPALLELADDDVFDLRITPVAKRFGDATVRMLGYNGSIPGPTLKVCQGSEITVQVTNDGDLDTTVHWHGLRLDNKYDGVPHETQTPIPVGGSFTYRIRFPDPGLYWYHPHIREDYTQELGLYGNILVVPGESGYWPPANRDVILTLDDLLLEDGKIASFSTSETTYTAMAGVPQLEAGSGHAGRRTCWSAGFGRSDELSLVM
jgi:FtsP/CotA-like multicopper oxidase with cupredoxin domain